MAGTRTPRNTLSSELIVRTALELMETNGTDAFSLRGVAAELGVGPMALYTYFRNKDDLYDAVRDHLMGLLPAVPRDVPWPDQVRAVCRSLRRLMLQHPCLPQLLAGRPLSGHETARVAEGLLGVLRTAGFDPATAARTHTTLVHLRARGNVLGDPDGGRAPGPGQLAAAADDDGVVVGDGVPDRRRARAGAGPDDGRRRAVRLRAGSAARRVCEVRTPS